MAHCIQSRRMIKRRIRRHPSDADCSWKIAFFSHHSIRHETVILKWSRAVGCLEDSCISLDQSKLQRGSCLTLQWYISLQNATKQECKRRLTKLQIMNSLGKGMSFGSTQRFVSEPDDDSPQKNASNAVRCRLWTKHNYYACIIFSPTGIHLYFMTAFPFMAFTGSLQILPMTSSNCA